MTAIILMALTVGLIITKTLTIAGLVIDIYLAFKDPENWESRYNFAAMAVSGFILTGLFSALVKMVGA